MAENNQFVPLKNYPGRKAGDGQYQVILSHIPKCDLFIEAMCGSAFISSEVLKTGCKVIANDLNDNVIRKLHQVQAQNFMEIEKLNIVLCNKHFADLMAVEFIQKNDVVYFDPPYLMETRSSKLKLYRYDWNRQDHVDFLEFIKLLSCKIMVSHYPCDLYDDLLKNKKWRKVEYNTVTHNGQVRKEALYMNYPPPVLLQCHKFVGKNFTDRQRIKRKANLLIKRFQKYSPEERAALLTYIIDNFKYLQK